jgi:4-amino-4-deoxy-L-arabinose transferase-like glycosyltransferase
MSATVVTSGSSAHRLPPTAGRLGRLLRGPARDPRWARPALLALLAVTALLYLWGLGRNGYANDFYAAAVQAGTKSWKAFFFGSFDSASFITVDKTPASLWVMELSGRIFGFSSWSMLVPQALEGVAAVALLYAAVRRWFGPAAGLIAGAVLALTPAAALMFRFNNPDALLVLLMTAAGYAVQRAIERDRTRWLVLAGTLIGFAFLAKMMQAFLVVPGFALAYLWAGPARLRRRVWQLLAALGGLIAGAGWWVLIAQLTPAADRPYFGGSTNNNILQLALGYNGLGRLDGTETGSIGFNSSSVGGGGGGGGGFGGATGLFRLFGSEFGGQVSWLIPAALLSLIALLWVSRRAARTSRVRAFALLWGGWLVVTALVFSYMQGIIHPYYMVALAPAIGALVGVGAAALLPSAGHRPAARPMAAEPGQAVTVRPGQALSVAGRAVAAAGVAGTAVWAYELLNRTPSWLPWLRMTVLIAGLLGAAAVFAVPALLARTARPRLAPDGPGGPGQLAARVQVLAYAPLALALIAGLGGPLAYSLDTANTTHTGAIPSAGPQVAGGFGRPGGSAGGPGGSFAGPGGSAGRSGTGFGTGAGAGTGTGTGTGAPSGGTGGTAAGANGTGPGGTGGFPGAPGSTNTGATGGTGSGAGVNGGTAPGGAQRGFGGMGGLSGSTEVSSALITLLEQDASRYRWIAATEGSQSAAPIELATGGDAVMAIGGFNGSDPSPTLAQFQAMVAAREIHYYVGQGANSFGGGSGSSAIASWVAAHFTAKTVGGVTIYDLTKQK